MRIADRSIEADRPRPYDSPPHRLVRRGLVRCSLLRSGLVGGAVLVLTAGWLQPAAAAPPTATPEVRELSVPSTTQDQSTRRSTDSGAPVGSVLAQLSPTRTPTFSTLGVTWAPGTTAEPQVQVRVRVGTGWSDWQSLETSNDADGAEAANARPGTDPLWVGDSNGVEVRLEATEATTGRAEIADVKVALIDPQSLASDAAPRTSRIGPPATAGTAGKAGAAAGLPYLYPAPAVVSRAAWGADEKLRSYNGQECTTPDYDTTIKAAIVHHTAGSNSYAASQSAGIVRGIYAYHTKSKGWCDIGYNLLVDKYGKVFEGRFGGIWNAVHGAHATAWNTDTVGLSLMGNFETATPSTAMMDSAAKVLAWKLEGHYRDPRGTLTLASKKIDVIAGHGDVMPTACPGRNVESRMGALRTKVSSLVGSYQTPIYDRWQQLGGESGALGSPTAQERGLLTGRVTHFEGADLLWSPATGTHLVKGSIRARYRSLAEARHPLGFPTSDETAGVLGSRQNTFTGGAIYYSAASGSVDVYKAFYRYHRGLGANVNRLGLPTASQRAGAVAGSSVQPFQHGSLYWLSSTGVEEVNGAIFRTYAGLGAERSRLRMPVRGDHAIPGGRASDFQGGTISYDSSTRAVTVRYR